MRMMAVLQDPDCELDDLERAISDDLGLSVRLLRWINSAYFLLPRKVSSVREALMLLGVRNVRSWALLMTLAGIEDQPSELIRTAMTRAKMCELVAQALDRPDTDAHFTVGLFSVVDAFMNTSMQDVLSELPLSAEVSDALLGRSGHLGEVLDWVLAYERGALRVPDALAAGRCGAARRLRGGAALRRRGRVVRPGTRGQSPAVRCRSRPCARPRRR